MKKTTFTTEQEESIINRFRAGETIQQLSKALKCWDGVISRVLVNNGIRTQRYNLSDEKIAEMVRLYTEGVSLDDFVELMGVTRTAATRILRDAGVEIRKSGPVLVYRIQDGQKQCGRCKKYKTVDAFGKSNGNLRAHIDGLQSWCRDCSAECSTWAKLKRIHGMDQSRYDFMHAAQQGLCAICSQPETRERLGKPCQLVVDHNHATGEIRGLLCSKCNVGLGQFNDHPVTLRKAAFYLENHGTMNSVTSQEATTSEF